MHGSHICIRTTSGGVAEAKSPLPATSNENVFLFGIIHIMMLYHRKELANKKERAGNVSGGDPQ